jgi:hypothetical protein
MIYFKFSIIIEEIEEDDLKILKYYIVYKFDIRYSFTILPYDGTYDYYYK